MTDTLKMTFNLEDGKTTSISLASPKEGITAEEVKPVMENIITKEAILVKGQKAVSIKDAVVRTVEERKLF
ncbi:MAG: DUF2922 domain-containing protein [Schwartzia succinivorans]|jgi:hypothetical protein|uniref:DUF2922 domain-containing protein n=1 Tax=Schwartzia succinivorans TaxID=55507 RepID=UPI002354FF61|nr:DUF2922 domain-containing protein [Schwartzia succinivorans]MBE6097607.1 DUF2922 domain-containing protein [Schwartzia succinivorans]MDY6295350.1 DUF2922 domain-containing protein [Schwartzia succinivorans]